jgi:hypothetical protein
VGDPLADQKQVDRLLDHFLQAHLRASFIQCSEDIAWRLQARGFFVNSFGIETDLVLSRWSSSGKRLHMLRKNYNKADRMGVKVVEITGDSEQLEAARSVSDSCLLATKQMRCELRLLTRPPVFAPEHGTRKFASFHNERMVGIGFFDPLCVMETRLGYVYQLLRESPEAQKALGLTCWCRLLKSFGRRALSGYRSGCRPIVWLIWNHSSIACGLAVCCSFRGRGHGTTTGQEFSKSRFCGDQKTFVASRSKFALPPLWNLAVETGIVRTRWSRLLWRMHKMPITRDRGRVAASAKPSHHVKSQQTGNQGRSASATRLSTWPTPAPKRSRASVLMEAKPTSAFPEPTSRYSASQKRAHGTASSIGLTSSVESQSR